MQNTVWKHHFAIIVYKKKRIKTLCYENSLLHRIITLFYSSLSSQSFKRGPFTNKGMSLPLVADFTGDGKLDVIGVAQYFSADGDLLLHTNISKPDSIIFKTVDLKVKAIGNPGFGDFDADGDMDLVVSDSKTSKILILLNNGDGSFNSFPQNSKLAFSFKTSDIDGDQDIDIVSLNSNESSVYLMVNNGKGTFETKSVITKKGDIRTIELADFDGDNDIDIIAGFYDFFDGQIMALENSGQGNFLQKILNVTAVRSLENIQIIDLDKDGDRDIAYSSSSSSTLKALINNGNKTYHEVNLVAGKGTLRSFNIADYNNDGILDIILGCNSEDNTYHQGKSSDSFVYDTEVITTIQPLLEIVNGDFDSDNDIDAVLSNGDFWWITNLLDQGTVSSTVVDNAIYNIYPNPFVNFLHIGIDENEVGILISDLLGKQDLLSYTKDFPINLDYLNDGVYFMSIFDLHSGKILQTSKIIKVR